MERWRTSGEQLFQWTAYRDRSGRAITLGCEDVVVRLGDGRLTTNGAVSAFEMAYYEAVYADQIRADAELGTFDGTLHGRLAREFADMDRQRIASASFEVVRAHHEKVPARDGGSVGPLGVLRAEIARKRGHMPIRRLMEKAAPAVQALTLNKKLEDVVVKTIAGFANGGGGTLLIGVADDGTVKGLERDYACLGGNRDKLELHLTNLLGKHFGSAFRASRIGVSFPQHDGIDVCRIEVGPAVEAQFVSLPDRGGTVAERFFVRSGNSTQELTPSQMHLYVGQRFRRRD